MGMPRSVSRVVGPFFMRKAAMNTRTCARPVCFPEQVQAQDRRRAVASHAFTPSWRMWPSRPASVAVNRLPFNLVSSEHDGTFTVRRPTWFRPCHVRIVQVRLAIFANELSVRTVERGCVRADPFDRSSVRELRMLDFVRG